MHRLLSTGLETIASAFAIIPIFLYLYKVRFHCRKTTIVYSMFALYLCAIYAVAGLPNILYMRFDLRMNMIPFAYMFSDRQSSILNVLLFVPMGIFLPVLWQKFHNAFKTILFGLMISVFIECMQIFTLRATDINDLMTNTLGTAFGYCVGTIFIKIRPLPFPAAKVTDFSLILGLVFCVMFFLHPFLSRIFWGILI